MIGRLAITGLLIASPSFAQSRVYTNADLGKPMTWTRTATAEELAWLAAHQFVAPPEIPTGPTVLTIAGDPTHGPFGPLEVTPPQPLDPNWQGNFWWGPVFASGGWFEGNNLPGARYTGRFDGPRGRGNTRPQNRPR